MKMNQKKMKELLTEKLQRPEWQIKYDREKNQLRVEDKDLKQGIDISVPGIIAKWEEKKEKAIDEVVYYVEETLMAMSKSQSLSGKEKKIFPVIRSTSFPTESKEGIPLIFEDHTAETRIYYALDLGTTYRLLDKDFAQKENWDEVRIKEVALFNLRSLPTPYKEDVVADNTFYFLNPKDGYDASRILNENFLEEMSLKMSGTMAIAVPHQDVLIIADIRNDYGYDIIGQMAMSFFADGRVPITALPFIYENKELDPIFILAKKKPSR